jgi:hypothetical protein
MLVMIMLRNRLIVKNLNIMITSHSIKKDFNKNQSYRNLFPIIGKDFQYNLKFKIIIRFLLQRIERLPWLKDTLV